MTGTCPRCHETYSVSGDCSCDGQNPPGSGRDHRRPARAVHRIDRSRSAAALDRAEVTRFRVADVAVRDLLACDIPGPNDRPTCEACLDRLSEILRATPGITLALNESRAGVAGIDYRTLGGTTGGSKTLPLVINQRAIEARDRLRTALWAAVGACLHARLDHTSPRDDVPHRGDLPAMAEWLSWRIDAMPGHPLTEHVPGSIALAVEYALHVLERPATRQRLGVCGCGGHVSAIRGAKVARCDTCDTEYDAPTLRAQRLTELDDQLCTAAEIAELTTYLSQTITSGRDVVRRRINVWATRGTLVAASVDVTTHEPRYRFGEVYALLLRYEARHVHSWGKWTQAPEQPDPDVVVMVRGCEFEGCTETKTRRRPAPRSTTRRTS